MLKPFRCALPFQTIGKQNKSNETAIHMFVIMNLDSITDSYSIVRKDCHSSMLNAQWSANTKEQFNDENYLRAFVYLMETKRYKLTCLFCIHWHRREEKLFIDVLKTVLIVYAFSYESCIYSWRFNKRKKRRIMNDQLGHKSVKSRLFVFSQLWLFHISWWGWCHRGNLNLPF